MDKQVQGEGTITKPAKNAAKYQRTSVVMQLVVHNKIMKCYFQQTPYTISCRCYSNTTTSVKVQSAKCKFLSLFHTLMRRSFTLESWPNLSPEIYKALALSPERANH